MTEGKERQWDKGLKGDVGVSTQWHDGQLISVATEMPAILKKKEKTVNNTLVVLAPHNSNNNCGQILINGVIILYCYTKDGAVDSFDRICAALALSEKQVSEFTND